MQSPESQQAYTQGYHVGYQHGMEAAGRGAAPSTYPFDLTARYPERSSRLGMFFLPFRGLLLIPHLIVLWFLSIGAGIVLFIAWWAVLIMGSYPRPLWDYMVGFNRWYLRVQAYALALTDEYPPFSLQ